MQPTCWPISGWAFFDRHKVVEPEDRRLIVEAETKGDQRLAASVSYPKSGAGELIQGYHLRALSA